MKASDFANEKFVEAMERTPFRALSPHTQAIDFHETSMLLSNFPTRPRSIFRCTTVTLGGLVRLTKLAEEAFAQKHWTPSWKHYSKAEKYHVMTSLYRENIMYFLSQCLMDPVVPITTNLIAFLLDLSAKLTVNQSGRAQVSMLIAAFLEKVRK